MELSIKNMNRTIIHTGAHPRLLPAAYQVASIGYLPAKSFWMNATFSVLNFSFILKGRGHFHYEGRHIPIKAPCVLMCWPGPHLRFGPQPADATWEELYIVYEKSLMPILPLWGILPEQQPVWQIPASRTVRTLVDELLGYLQYVNEPGMPDRMDRICERLVLESRLKRIREPQGPHDHKLTAIADHMAAHIAERPNFATIASAHGMSPATFRRHWLKRFGVSPLKHLTRLRMQQACRLLVERADSVQQIAARLGFDDPLYFSRCFAEAHSVSPTAYRRTFGNVPAIQNKRSSNPPTPS